MQPIARDANADRFEMKPGNFFIVSKAKKYDPQQPRGAKGTSEGGRWVKTVGRAFTSDEGYDWHEQGPGRAWALQMTPDDLRAVSNYVGFGYHDVNDLRRGTYKVPITNYFVRAATPEEMRRLGWDVEKDEWVPSIKVKEGEYKPGYTVDPRDAVTPESIARFGHPMGRHDASDYDPDDPSHRVDDGRIIVNQYYRPTPDSPPMMFSIQRAGPNLERLADVTQQANQLDDMIANRGLVLNDDIVVERGAYLPGVTVDDLQALSESGQAWEEKGFTSTFLGDAGGRARSYPALGKWESIMHRFGSTTGALAAHEDEVGTAVRFYITLPAGTKVASAEAARRIRHDFPKVQDPIVFEHPEWTADGRTKPEDYTKPDYTQKPTVDTRDLDDKSRRSESEIIVGSGARFRVTRVKKGYTYQTGDDSLKPVEVYEVHMEYIGGGSSQSDLW